MVPVTFAVYFSASANAGAALAGLLFLAVTVGPVPTVGRHAPVERASVATSAFSALIKAFRVSLAALLPGMNFGAIALGVSIVSLLATLRIGRQLSAGRRSALARVRRLVLVGMGVVLHGIEAWQAGQVLGRPDDPQPVGAIASVVMAVYAVGILRAWELVGAERHGFLSHLSPLRDLDQAAPAPRQR